MSFFSINALAPVIQQSESGFHERLAPERETYTISVERGFDSASFTLRGENDYLVDWFKNGLIRDMVWLGPDGMLVWNGFVESLSLSLGGITRTKSAAKMGNRIIFVYSQIDTTTNPPRDEGQVTITVNDTAAQAEFGIKTIVESGGEATATNANVAALTTLNRLAKPLIGETQTVGGGQPPSLKVSMKGYAYMADWYVYTQTVSSGTANADVVILAVLAADPNAVLAASTLAIDANTTATEQFQEQQPGWKVIDIIAQRGETVAALGRRWAAGIYSQRRLTFKAAEGLDSNGQALSSNKHLILSRSLADPGDIFTDEAGRVVEYWHLRPDRLLRTEGIRGDVTFVRKVTFSPPTGVSLVGEDDLQPLAGGVRG